MEIDYFKLLQIVTNCYILSKIVFYIINNDNKLFRSYWYYRFVEIHKNKWEKIIVKNGCDGHRSHDLSLAKGTLYHLSYTPIQAFYCWTYLKVRDPYKNEKSKIGMLTTVFVYICFLLSLTGLYIVQYSYTMWFVGFPTSEPN